MAMVSVAPARGGCNGRACPSCSLRPGRGLLNLPLSNLERTHTLSHVVTIKSEVKDAAAVRAACQRLGLPQPLQGTHRLFTNSATGLAVQLPGWRYPAVCDLVTGQVAYDDRLTAHDRRHPIEPTAFPDGVSRAVDAGRPQGTDGKTVAQPVAVDELLQGRLVRSVVAHRPERVGLVHPEWAAVSGIVGRPGALRRFHRCLTVELPTGPCRSPAPGWP
jgi:hypothetical protein